STGLMAPINFSAITFVPGMEFAFGSLGFIAGADGRLRFSNPEATLIVPIDLDRADRIFTRSVFEPNFDQLRDRSVLPRYPFGFRNSANTFRRMLNHTMEVQAERKADVGKNGR